MSEDDERIELIRKRKRNQIDGPKRKKTKPNIASHCPNCFVKATIRKKRPPLEVMICDSCDLPVPFCEPLLECTLKCENKDLCSNCASGKLKRAKKRNRLSIFQKFEAFELALIVDGALQGEDLDCVKCGMKEQRELINRTRLALTTLCLPKGLNRVKQEKLNMVRCILMEFHVKQVRTDPTYSFDEESRWCKIQGWNIPGAEIKGETRSVKSEEDLNLAKGQCINESCFALQVENGKARILQVKWEETWPNMRPAHESSDVVLYIAPHNARPCIKPKPKPAPIVYSESETEQSDFTICTVCKLDNNADKLLLCDHPMCENVGYHIYCLTPKLTSIPEGDWYCPRKHPLLLDVKCPTCQRRLYSLPDPPLKWKCQRRGHPKKIPKEYGASDLCYGCTHCDYHICPSCRIDLEALLPAPASDEEKEEEDDEFSGISSVSPVSSDDERIFLSKPRKAAIKRPPMKRKREEPQRKPEPPRSRPPPKPPAPPQPPPPKPKSKTKLLKPRILRSIPKKAHHRSKVPRPQPVAQDVRRHPQQRPVRHSESRNERRLKTQAHKIPSRQPIASFRSRNPHLFQYTPLKNFFKQFPINAPDIVHNADFENFFKQNPHLRAPEHIPPLPPLPILKQTINHQPNPPEPKRKRHRPVPNSELQKQLAALNDLCTLGTSSSSSEQNGDMSNSTIGSSASVKQIDPPRMQPFTLSRLMDGADNQQSTVSMSISPEIHVSDVRRSRSPRHAHPPQKPPPPNLQPQRQRASTRELEKCFQENRKDLKPFTEKPNARKQEQHRVNLMRHGIKVDAPKEEPEDDAEVEPGEIKNNKIVRFVLPQPESSDTPKYPPVELGTLDDYLTPEEEKRYLNRLIDVWSFRCLKEGMPSSPAFDLGAEVREPFFTWTKNEFFISGQPASRVHVQVTIQTTDSDKDAFKCKGTIMAAKSNSISRPLPSSIVLFPDFHISTKVSINQQLCFSQYLFKKQKRHMKLDVFIPKEKREQITEFVRCRPAVKALNFIRAPLDYQTWLVPVRQIQNNLLQCQVYFVNWDFFSKLCDQRYRVSLMKRKLNLIIQIEHFLADIIVDPSQPQRRDKKVKPKFEVKLKIDPKQFLPLLEHFDITLISEHQQSMINEVVRQLGLERDQFLDEFHRRLFAGIPKTTEGLYSFAQYFEFYHYRRRRNTVLGIADPSQFVEGERDFIFSRDTPQLLERLQSVQKEFFKELDSLDDAKETSLADILFKLRNNWE